MKDTRVRIASEYSNAGKDNEKRSLVSRTGSARFASYTAEELKDLPKEAVDASFGCGNPLAFASVQRGQTVLDLGCGAGLDLLIAAEKVGPEGIVIGVDMTDAMLEKAKRTITASALMNVQVRKGFAEALPVDSKSIDWVISNCVINLSPDKKKVFSEIARVLKPGGQIIISDIVAEGLPWWVRRSGSLTAACAGGAISETQYLEGLRDAGLAGCRVLGRQHYEPIQMASVVVESLPLYLQNATCCGKAVASSALIRIAEPISRRLWSARITARKPITH